MPKKEAVMPEDSIFKSQLGFGYVGKLGRSYLQSSLLVYCHS
jgi:hypothetical protein